MRETTSHAANTYFKNVQPTVEDLLFLGGSYEDLFDRLEIFYALTYCDIEDHAGHHFWGPPGRFGWKFNNRRSGNDPYSSLIEEAEKAGDSWAPLRAGFFGGSIKRFKDLAERYDSELLSKLPWH